MLKKFTAPAPVPGTHCWAQTLREAVAVGSADRRLCRQTSQAFSFADNTDPGKQYGANEFHRKWVLS